MAAAQSCKLITTSVYHDYYYYSRGAMCVRRVLEGREYLDHIIGTQDE